MRIVRFSYGDPDSAALAFGILVEEPGANVPERIAVIDGHPFGEISLTGAQIPLVQARMLPPILPSKVVAIGKNYADHAREMGGEPPAEPVMFLKPSTSVVGPGATIAYPSLSQHVDFEGELAVVIGRLCREVPLERAADVVLGYTCANDVTARDLQEKDGQWTRAKGFDTFCPLGPVIETELAPDAVLRTRLNGELKQEAPISDMVHDIPSIIAYASSVFTLLPGDVILTGTPSGIGPMKPGDTVEVEVDGVGSLVNPVRAPK